MGQAHGYLHLVLLYRGSPAFSYKCCSVNMYHGVLPTPYVGMAPPKSGGHIKSAQMTCSKCLH